MTSTADAASVDPGEIERFSRIAAQWWDPTGKFAPLHRFNPVRLGFIRTAAERRFDRAGATRPFEGLRLLDVGCGGGLVSEPMSRLGFTVTGLDASERNIGVARAHAEGLGLTIDYRCAAVETLVSSGEALFDVVLVLEVIEHVSDPKTFLCECLRLVKPGGMMVLATLNRTLKSLALAKIGAEYVLGWLPRGAHDWRKFLKPEEIQAFLGEGSRQVTSVVGVGYDALRDRWAQSDDLSVNYMMLIAKDPDLES
jgi:2-polyprenyl-6-hydroxyphenyl methylase/3-demethylubiquinone-9 3-methyltransferase